MNDYIAVKKQRAEKKVSLNNFFQGVNTSADESVLPLSTAAAILNFDYASGALKEGYGIKSGIIGAENVTNIWVYNRYDFDSKNDESYLMYSDFDGKVFYLNLKNLSNPVMLANAVFSSVPFAVNYRLYGEDVVLMCSENDGMLVWNGIDPVYKVEDAPHITSLALHYERLFVTVDEEKNTVRFSDDLDPTNWGTDLTEGGFIQMLDERGKLNKVISFLNYIYIFRDYGVSRVTAYADQSEFSATNLYVSSGKIHPKSVMTCGDTVLFLAGDGLYRFDGASTSKLLPQLDNYILSSPDSCAAYHNGKYYAAVRVNNGDNTGYNNALLVYDIKTGIHTLSDGLDIRAFSVINDELYCVLKSGKTGKVEKCGEIFGLPTIKIWKSGMLDFGTDKIKRIKEFYADADTPFDLTVFSEKGEKTYTVLPQGGITKLKLNLCGRKIGFEICAKTKTARISRPGLIISVI